MLLLVAYGLAYAGAYWTSVRFGVIAFGAGAAAAWVPSGLQVAALLMLPLRRWWPVVLGVGATSELLTGWALFGSVQSSSVAVAAGNALEATLVAGTVRWVTGRATPDFHRVRDVIALAGAAVVGPAVNAAVTVPAFAYPTWHQRWEFLRVDWLGDVTGIVAVVPVVLAVWGARRPGRSRPPLPSAGELLGLALTASVVLLLVFGWTGADVANASAVALLWPVLAWAAFRLGPTGTAAVNLALIVSADALTRAGRGPFGGVTEEGGARVAALQGLLIVMSLSSVALAAVLFERAQAETALAQAGETDPLTGLPTWELARRAIQRLRGNGALTAVLVVDLDAFAHINQAHGHAVGDEVLRQVGQRLRMPLRTEDVVARGTGDAFVVVVGRLASNDSAQLTAERVLATLTPPLVVGGTVVAVSACSGLAVLEEREAPEAVLSRAQSALEQAQARGPGHSMSLDLKAYGRLDESRRLQGQLPHALAAGELELHYQPIVDVNDLRVVAVEALLRWRHPQQGLLTAGTFVPDAETSGLVVALDTWVIPRAVADLARLRTLPGLGEVRLFLNISARTLTEPATGPLVREALRGRGVAPAAVVLELTETALVQDSEAGRQAAHELATEGLSFAIDDFGQGHASLARLRSLPISVVKIDHAFVTGIGTHTIDAAVVRWTTLLAHELQMSTVAEGVETAEQLHRLQVKGVDLAQGFWLAPPLPLEQLATRVTPSGHLVLGPVQAPVHEAVPAPRRPPSPRTVSG